MAKRIQSVGKCEICGGEFSKSAMGRHLKACIGKHAVPPKNAKLHPMFHLSIEGRYLPDFWIHIETATDTKFDDVDAYLRELWLECCGHMSAFRFPVPKQDAMKLAFNFDFEAMEREEARLMASKLGSRLKVGDKIDYEYDFGSTTELKIKVVAEREGTLKPGKIKLMARNLMPDIRCECGKPAVEVCTQCMWDGDGWLCKACGRKHECDEEMFLPVVNSPRVGVCAYAG